MTAPLPIDPLLSEIVGSLRRIPNLVLRAAPGAGKTTRVPAALLDGGLAPLGEILVSEPRRMAARAAARRVAAERKVEVGQEVGYRVRLDNRAGPATRITFVTEGILLRRLQVDPELAKVDVVVLDEFHERSLQADLALALLAEVQRELRPELRILVMSATLEATPLAAYLGDCPVLEAQGREHPIQIQHVEQPDPRPLAVRMAGALARALDAPEDDGGHLLAFLPGAAEIRRVADHLAGVAQRHSIRVMPLHGSMDARAQDAALAPGGGRKLILATNVAETSLTIDGVTTVVDCGLVKQLRQDPRFGLDRLALVDISRASATQRAGRAGRTAPGRVVRLWTRGEHHGRPERERAEVGRVDLAGAVLQLRAWGCAEPADFPWFEAPPAASLERADRLLGRLGAVDRAGVTPLGRRMLTAGLHPRLARMLVAAHDAGWLLHGALLAALASEPDVLSAARVFGDPGALASASAGIVGASDLLWRLERVVEAGHSKDAALRSQGLDPRATRRVRAVARQLAATAQAALSGGQSTLSSVEPSERDLLGLLLLGYPDRVGLRRRAGGSRVLLDGGREAELDPASVVREGTLLLAHRVEDGQQGRAARVRLASQISAGLLAEVLPGSVRAETVLSFDEETQRVVAERQRRFGTLVLERRTVPVEDRAAAGELVARAASRAPRQALAWGPEVDRWLARVRFAAHHLPEAGFPRFDDEALKTLTGELCLGRLSFDELRRVDLLVALGGRLSRKQVALLDREVPESLTVPSGSRIRLDYGASPRDPPVLAVRIQEIFGLAHTPQVARGRVAVLLHLLAPNQRPAQVTQDLESFWERGYHEVRKELAGRYPKHAWPADPRAARATRRTRRHRK